ncbi:hypothetical protein SAMN02910447_02740 [Ruminococcus sp. YE71]|nr:hypothetical protein [Ruminococcus sp. YE78]SDA27499.1 hypothetical protein SAMN02910446_02812 [Ruminococcus sp. YE78]SFW44969.1 hypothetical protein SAMN02910447_02740 [Ruminococcus sp. YE71]
MKEFYYTMIVKANGLKAYYGKRNTEVFPIKGTVDAEDSAVGYESEEEAVKNQNFIENYCRTMGIAVSEMKAVALEGE